MIPTSSAQSLGELGERSLWVELEASPEWRSQRNDQVRSTRMMLSFGAHSTDRRTTRLLQSAGHTFLPVLYFIVFRCLPLPGQRSGVSKDTLAINDRVSDLCEHSRMHNPFQPSLREYFMKCCFIQAIARNSASSCQLPGMACVGRRRPLTASHAWTSDCLFCLSAVGCANVI